MWLFNIHCAIKKDFQLFVSYRISNKMSLKSIWKRYMAPTDLSGKPPEKDPQMIVSDTLMSELDFHIKLLDNENKDEENEEECKSRGVDYSWLVTSNKKGYSIPQLERLELEELCSKVNCHECGKVINLFRDALIRKPLVQEVPAIMRACICQIVEQRPQEESLKQWLTRRTSSLSNLRLRSSTGSRVAPCDEDDEESYGLS